MLLALCTWPEVAARLRTSDAIVVPIGSTEQHGPTGAIGTDALCAAAVAKGVGEAADTLVAPTLALGMAQHHLAFPGTITLRPSTLIAVVGDLVASLRRHGFARFFFLNGHGGNIATLQAAFSEIHAEASLAGRDGGLSFAIHNWWDGDEVVALSKELYGDRCGAHATPPEIAVTRHLHPEMAAKTATLGDFDPTCRGFGDAADFRRLYPDGRIASDPSLARPEHGARLLALAVSEATSRFRAFLAERP
ncbi:MAG: creatininase family protein [Alphaproteobacteria bacterium]|nr:creatininase family protein [Alphaproteobacteria bacterium]MBF0332504.1 creatininase family protein [Alphaproteobacteria bacterium]